LGSSGAKRVAAALCLCLAGAAVSALLLLQHHGEGRAVTAVNQVCGEGEDGAPNDCDTVSRSPWSSLRGFPIAGLGVVFYASLALLLALTLLVPDGLRAALAGIALIGLVLGLLVDLFLLGIQAFSIGAYCTLCLLTYVLGAAALLVLLPAWRGLREPDAALDRSEGRLAIAGWVLGTIALTGGVVAAETALDYREQQRQLALLGAPTAPSPSPPASETAEASAEEASPPEESASEDVDPVPAEPDSGNAKDAAYWEQRAKALQQTLDDPQKLEQYFSEKAQRQFETAAVQQIDLEGVPAKGPSDAPVKVVEYSDFLCPFCRNLAAGLTQFVPQAGGRMVLYFKNYPLDKECNAALSRSTHPGSCQLALGAICAGYQGKFPAYHNRVFAAEGLNNPQASDVVRLAGEAGLNAEAVRGCLEDPQAKADLAAQIEEGQRLGIQATPTVYINGKLLPRINDFVAVVDREAQKSGFPPLAQSQ
jgi:protein-disulfide isomerase/uncharacterized membrane protein